MKKLSVQGLKRLRRERGLTQEAFAKLLGYSAGYISKFENGHLKPGYQFVATVRKVVGRWKTS